MSAELALLYLAIFLHNPSSWFTLIIPILVWLDSRDRAAKGCGWWTLGALVLPLVIVPSYLAKRPLKEGELREGGFVWNFCRAYALIWTISLGLIWALVTLQATSPAALALTSTISGATLAVAWFAVMVIALVVGSIGKNSAIIEKGKPITREGCRSKDLKIVGAAVGVLVVGWCLFAAGSVIVNTTYSICNSIKKLVVKEYAFIYPVDGASETNLTVKPGSQDPDNAIAAIRHPLPGTKVEILGDGPIGGTNTQMVRVAEGDLKGTEGWTFAECLSSQRRNTVEKHAQITDESIAWSFQTRGEIHASPIFSKGVVFLGSDDHCLYALDAATGKEKWRYSSSAAIEGGICSADNKIFFGANDGQFYAINEIDGHLLWQYIPLKTGDTCAIFTTPRVIGQQVVFGTLDGYLRSLDILTGKMNWEFKTGAEINSSPAQFGQLIIFGCRDDYLYALDLNGNEKWKFNVSGTINGDIIKDQAAILTSAKEYSPLGSSIYSIVPETGNQIWRFHMPKEDGGSFSPLVIGDKVICVSDGAYERHNKHYIYALNRNTGSALWKRQICDITTSLSRHGTQIVFGSTNGVYQVNSTDGAITYYQNLGEIRQSKPLVTNDIAFIGSKDFSCYALKLPNGTTPLKMADSYPFDKLTEISEAAANEPSAETIPKLVNKLRENSNPQPVAIANLEPDPRFLELQKQNEHYQQELDRLKSEITQTTKTLLKKEADLERATNRHKVLSEFSKSQDTSISELIATVTELKRSKLKEITAQSEEDNVTLGKASSNQDVVWQNALDFRPTSYKCDIARRLSAMSSTRKIGNFLNDTPLDIALRFEIQADGRPCNITIESNGIPEESQTKCQSFIQAAGPFKPLLSDYIESLQVKVSLKENIDSRQIELNDLEIEALGNRL